MLFFINLRSGCQWRMLPVGHLFTGKTTLLYHHRLIYLLFNIHSHLSFISQTPLFVAPFTTKKYTFIFHFLSQSPNLIYGRIQFFRHLSQCYRRYCYDQRQQIALSFRQIAIIDGFIYFFGEFSGFFGIFLFFHSLAISVKRYFCLGCLGCLGYSRSIAPSSNVGLR